MRAPFKLNTIFWKIFLSIWGAMILVTLATSLTVGLLMDRDHFKSKRELMDRHQAAIAVTVFESAGRQGLERWFAQLPDQHRRGVFLLDEAKNEVLGRRLPPPLANLSLGDERQELDFGRRRAIVQPTTSTEGAHYWLVKTLPNHRPNYRAEFWHSSKPLYRGVLFLLSLLVTGLVSFWLARNITSPIRQLGQTTRLLSAGELGTRVAAQVTARRDEIGELGREFDRMAEHIEELLCAQQRMLRDVSHELRSPLARLQIALELARKAVGEKGALGHDRIEKEANRLDELIGQILSLVRLTTQGSCFQMESLDVRDILEQVIADANYEAEQEGKAALLLESISFPMQGNQHLLHSALENIVRNAVKYAPQNSQVEVQMQAPSAEQLRIRVRDHGPGVADATLHQLFEPFFREAEARDRASGGYGLGLTIARQAVRLHGGEILAFNAPDGGLIMEISLPKSN